jgi:hypothetical protein
LTKNQPLLKLVASGKIPVMLPSPGAQAPMRLISPRDARASRAVRGIVEVVGDRTRRRCFDPGRTKSWMSAMMYRLAMCAEIFEAHHAKR